jgi:hypothetical protein
MNSITKGSLGPARRQRQGRPASIEVAAQSRINASLFYELARVVSWAARNDQFVSAHPELGRLLESSASTLRKGGILEHPAECLAA